MIEDKRFINLDFYLYNKGDYMKGQISAEMLIILAIVVAIALLVATQMVNMAKESKESVEKAHSKTLQGLNETIANASFS